MSRLALLTVLAAFAGAAPALAQSYSPPPPPYSGPAAPQVTVTLGPPLATRVGLYGERDIADLQHELTQDVQRALARGGPSAPVGVELVLEDVKPNRPTFAQLGREPSLSMRSIALGGARVGGWATLPNGARIPIRFSWYESSLQEELGPTTWTDAERAFDMLASSLRRGDVPQRYGPGDLSGRHYDFDDRWPFSRWQS
jgi:hypothetical protein